MPMTQHFISFIQKNCSLAIADLQSTISLISSRMSSNYFMLNPSKTEFLLIGLLQKTSKIINPSFSLPTAQRILLTLSAKSSALSLTPLSFSPNRSPPFQVLVSIIFEISTISDTPSISPLPPQLLLLSLVH